MSAQNFYFAPKFSLNAGFSVPSSAFSDKKIPTRRFSDNNFKGGGRGEAIFSLFRVTTLLHFKDTYRAM